MSEDNGGAGTAVMRGRGESGGSVETARPLSGKVVIVTRAAANGHAPRIATLGVDDQLLGEATAGRSTS